MFVSKRWRSFTIVFVMACMSNMANASPDALFINAKVFTADEAKPSAQAFAIEGGRIVAIGEQKDILAQKGAKTQLVDLQGKRVLPGLIDAHTHAVIAGLAALSPNLQDEELSIDIVKQRVQAWREDAHDEAGHPLVVFGVNPSTWQEPRALAEVFDAGDWASQPLLLMGSDLHTAWVNRAMRTKAGIDAAYAQGLSKAQRHTVGVGADGEPDGILVDAGVDLVTVQLPKPDEALLRKAGQFAVRANNAYGITAWMDPAANARPDEAPFSRAPGRTGT